MHFPLLTSIQGMVACLELWPWVRWIAASGASFTGIIVGTPSSYFQSIRYQKHFLRARAPLVKRSCSHFLGNCFHGVGKGGGCGLGHDDP